MKKLYLVALVVFSTIVDLHAQQEFLSYPRGKHDDILDAIAFLTEQIQ